jgi:hypothetical protein
MSFRLLDRWISPTADLDVVVETNLRLCHESICVISHSKYIHIKNINTSSYFNKITVSYLVVYNITFFADILSHYNISWTTFLNFSA